jgi:hypothetical protein
MIVNAFAEAESDERAVETRLPDHIRHVAVAAEPLGIRMENKTSSAEDIAPVAKDRLFVRVKLD